VSRKTAVPAVPVWLIHGPEELLRRRALAALLDEIGVTTQDFDLETHTADSSKLSEWVAAAGTVPFLAVARVVIIRHLLRAGDPKEARPEQLATVPSSGRLILIADEEATLDEDRQRRFTDLARAWSRAILAAGGTVIEANVPPAQFSTRLRSEAESLGKALTPTASDVLKEMCGGSFSRAVDEVEKLSLFVGDRANIQEADVHQVASASREHNIFRLVESIASGEASPAFAQLRTLFGNTARPDDAANRFLAPLSRQFRLVWQARAAIDAKVGIAQMKQSIPGALAERPRLDGEQEFVQQKSLRLARRLSLPSIAACLHEIADCDARLKGLRPASSALDSIETMVVRCLEHTAARTRD